MGYQRKVLILCSDFRKVFFPKRLWDLLKHREAPVVPGVVSGSTFIIGDEGKLVRQVCEVYFSSVLWGVLRFPQAGGVDRWRSMRQPIFHSLRGPRLKPWVTQMQGEGQRVGSSESMMPENLADWALYFPTHRKSAMDGASELGWRLKEKHTSGAKARIFSHPERPKAEALGYPDARQRTTSGFFGIDDA